MALWMVRGGRGGEHESRFLNDSKVYLTWSGLQQVDLGTAKTREDVRHILDQHYQQESNGKLVNWTGQIWGFVVPMKPGDWVVMPRKTGSAIAIGEIAGPYTYSASAEVPYRHSRAVKWLNPDVLRSAFDQDLLFSFGAFMTVCQISRNDAEQRVRAMAATGWKSAPTVVGQKGSPHNGGEVAPDDQGIDVDLEQLARDQVAKLIGRRFKGHELTHLVDAVLRAQNYTTFVSPVGPDKGIDILAAPGPLGFGHPRICVQVKSQDSPIDSPTLHQLIGSMQNVQADQGLLVAWGGFKGSVDQETPTQFFRVRLWDQRDLIEQLLQYYDALDADIRAELPLKRIWSVAREEEE
jgi:restriction system protein